MKVWLFNPFDVLPWEGKAQRYASLAACLAEQGHTVVHWSSGFSHSFKRRREVPADFDLAELPYAIELVDCPGYASNIGLQRIWNHRAYGKGLVAQAIAAVASGRLEAPDRIVASLPPMEGPIAALELRQRFGCRVVLDVMDAWPETLQLALSGRKVDEGGKVESVAGASCSALSAPSSELRAPRSPLLAALSSVLLYPYTRMLRRSCREADAVCAQSQAFADYARRYGATGEIPVFYLASKDREPAVHEAESLNQEPPVRHSSQSDGGGTKNHLSAGLSGVASAKSEAQRAKEEEPPPPLRLLYLGSMGRVYDLKTLVDAVLRLLESGAALRLDLVGEGAQRATLERKVQAAGREDAIRFHGYLTGAALTEVVSAADVGVVPMWPASLVAVPYKAGDYLAAGLAVVNSLPGELARMLAEYACGVSYHAGQADDLIRALRPWLEDRSALAAAKSGARRLFTDAFDAEAIYPKYAAWLEAVAERDQA